MRLNMIDLRNDYVLRELGSNIEIYNPLDTEDVDMRDLIDSATGQQKEIISYNNE